MMSTEVDIAQSLNDRQETTIRGQPGRRPPATGMDSSLDDSRGADASSYGVGCHSVRLECLS
jgi:hypothetical protein